MSCVTLQLPLSHDQLGWCTLAGSCRQSELSAKIANTRRRLISDDDVYCHPEVYNKINRYI